MGEFVLQLILRFLCQKLFSVGVFAVFGGREENQLRFFRYIEQR